MEGTFRGMLLALLIVAVATKSFVKASGNIGCLFSEELCKPEVQWCFDDGAFGRCMNEDGSEQPSDMYRYNLDTEDLGKLENELGRLLSTGYRWSHRHTQCILQALLYSIQTGVSFERIICDRLKDKDLETALNSGDVDDLDDPRDTAFISYTPSEGDPQSDYADEVYYPPEEQSQDYDENEPYALVRRSLPENWASDHFSTLYNTPEHFRSGFELKDLPMTDPTEGMDDMPYFPLASPPQLPEDQNYEDYPGEYIGGPKEDQQVSENGYPELDMNPGYTEGGIVYVPSNKEGKDMFSKGSLLESLGFKRRERLDVKKPGPPYDPAFKVTTTVKPSDSERAATTKPEGQKEVIANDLPQVPLKYQFAKKLVDQIDSEQYEVVDTAFAYIKFKNSIRTWKEGSLIVNTVAKLLKVPRYLFTQERVDRNEVTFKVVEPNPMGLNASEVSRRMDGIKDELRREIGVIVTSTGVGDKAKMPAIERMDMHSNPEMYVITVIAVGTLAALGLSAGVLYLTKRHGFKLKNLTSDTESSKHYQDLCRARMSAKNSPPATNDGNSGSVPAQRVTSLSKESDKDSPSSRSSTSSWSDEPALTNMDVSTGQMVLTYMEEHLKNKDRLDSEWTALCAYEADPSATTIAQRAENLQKNRYPHALPYDHARVVLNELSNITESDYINASTIADHDPRNAAYIVTQGPLPHTVPDLWQMVWEQGCVVMVMLTRVGEPEAPLCHRYWPEDGSEIYHIYAVHLVGEYMWCDDYVVRSFYLKNLKTGETRTVTQFHFLSWPDGGVPSSTKSLLEFRRKVNKSFRGRSCPIVVHCSDGVGRSGAYVLMDMVLNRIAKGAKEIDIAATLEHIRDQRAGAVATIKQFQFVLTAVADEVQAILKVLQQQ